MNPWRLGLVLAVLAVVLYGAGSVVGALMFRPVRIVHLPSPPAVVHNAADIERSLGKPDQSIAGAQVNPNLKGATCDVYQTAHIVLCH